MSLELKVTSTQAAPVVWNYEEIKDALATRLNALKNLQYDEFQLQEAKKDAADLNRLKKALNDERLNQERKFMEPFAEFKSQVKELCGMIDQTTAGIKSQVETFEAKRKAEKLKELQLVFEMTDKGKARWLTMKQIFDQSWLNASSSISKAKIAMKEKIERINTDLEMIEQIPEAGELAIEIYKKTLDASRSVAEAQERIRMQKEIEERRKQKEEARKSAEAEQPKPDSARVPDPVAHEEPQTEPTVRVRFTAELTRSQAEQLQEWFWQNRINFRFERA